MSVAVAEYYGHRTDATRNIVPETSVTALCPFMKDTPCKKLANDKKPPVCVVRKSTKAQPNAMWIACSKRLCASQRNASLSSYQKSMLLSIAQILFGSSITSADVCVKAEVPIKLRESSAKSYRADYIFALQDPSKKSTSGPIRLIVEMQGGGETSNTKLLTSLVIDWEKRATRTNAELQSPVKEVGTLETNAWRRQQEQFLVKGSAAKTTDQSYGIALCVGQTLFEYIVGKIGKRRLDSIRKVSPDAWTLAIIPIIETTASDPQGIKVGNSIPLKPDAGNTLLLDYNEFVNILVGQGGNSKEAFSGEFMDLNGQKVHL